MGVELSSYDRNFHEFEISFLEKKLKESDAVNILTVFESSKKTSESTTEIRDGSAFFSFNTALIDRDEEVTNYVYLKSGDSQAEIGAFKLDVKLSRIDKGAKVVTKVYSESYEILIQDFEKEIRAYLPKLETMNQEEGIRQDEEALRKLAETDRVSSEDRRKTSESIRVANESARKKAEAERTSKDSERDSKIRAIEGLQVDLISGAVDSASVQQHVEERYEQLEQEYAPRLTELEQNERYNIDGIDYKIKFAVVNGQPQLKYQEVK